MFGNLPAYFFYAKNRIHVNSTIKLDRTKYNTKNHASFLTFFGVSMESHFISELHWNSHHISNNIGRGVWESNPPGTAPSDPSAVLKTVRPTGAPTPPCFAQLNKREIWLIVSLVILLVKTAFVLALHLPRAVFSP